VFRSRRHKPRLREASKPRDAALEAFRDVAVRVERSKEALLAAVPRGRGEGAPLAEALAAFEDRLREANQSLQGWPAGADVTERRAIADALEQSLRRAESLRLGASPHGYEQLYALLGEILDPLDAVSEAGDRLVR
jgi:hypothetical protein